MHKCTEQRFLREGGFGTIAAVLDVPCGFYTSWERGVATSFFKHLHCRAQIMPKAFVMMMRPAPQRIRSPLQIATSRTAQPPRTTSSQYFWQLLKQSNLRASMTLSRFHDNIV
jgi:hypothetical protein